jgi:subtilisin-like proprotein convertase family protein
LTVSTTSNTAVPDASLIGITSTLNVGGMSGLTAGLTVNLDITGGFSGDLYAYLLSPQGTMVVLLNRAGMGSANYFGYGDAGFNITLDSASTTNIHNYQSGSYTLVNGQLAGTWAPDSRAIDPLSEPSVFDLAPAGNTLASLYGLNPNGIWTLYVADLSGGGQQSTLVSWGLTVVTVPEPQTWVMLGGGLALFFLCRSWRRRRV